MQNVIERLEYYGNKVDVVVTDRVCNLTGERIISRIGKDRVNVHSQWAGGNQRVNIMWAIEQLQNYSAQHNMLASSCGLSDTKCVAVKYSLVLVLRHDTVWTEPMDRWPQADFRKVLFPYKCPRIGVHDLFMIMPGPYLKFFYDALAKRTCFGAQDGHNCFKGIKQLTNKSSVGLVLRPPLASEMRQGRGRPRSELQIDIPWYTGGHPRAVC